MLSIRKAEQMFESQFSLKKKGRNIMYELGKKKDVLVELKPLLLLTPGRPTSLPYLPQGETVVCGYDQGLGERLIVCESLEDMQELYDKYAQGWALNINWYTAHIRPVKVFKLDADEGIAGQIINDHTPNAPEEVKKAVAAYAMGIPGTARVLAELAKNFQTAKDVEDLVGWPLSEHTMDKAGELWDRFN